MLFFNRITIKIKEQLFKLNPFFAYFYNIQSTLNNMLF